MAMLVRRGAMTAYEYTLSGLMNGTKRCFLIQLRRTRWGIASLIPKQEGQPVKLHVYELSYQSSEEGKGERKVL